MAKHNWVTMLFQRPRRSVRPAHEVGLMECLEDRTTPTVVVVSTPVDEDLGAADAAAALADGTGLSLREAVRLANENGGGRARARPTGT